MNLFYLDENLDLCAEAHIDRHITKMQLEAAQLMSTALWVDRLFGFVPRKLNGDELAELRLVASKEPHIDSRTFIRYLPTHPNHPCNEWVRSSLDNFEWTFLYIDALNDEAMWRGYKSHASCAEAHKMPSPNLLPSLGLTPHVQAMPEELKGPDSVEAYRRYYLRDKASIATWKRRGPPEWWKL